MRQTSFERQQREQAKQLKDMLKVASGVIYPDSTNRTGLRRQRWNIKWTNDNDPNVYRQGSPFPVEQGRPKQRDFYNNPQGFNNTANPARIFGLPVPGASFHQQYNSYDEAVKAANRRMYQQEYAEQDRKKKLRIK